MKVLNSFPRRRQATIFAASGSVGFPMALELAGRLSPFYLESVDELQIVGLLGTHHPVLFLPSPTADFNVYTDSQQAPR